MDAVIKAKSVPVAAAEFSGPPERGDFCRFLSIFRYQPNWLLAKPMFFWQDTENAEIRPNSGRVKMTAATGLRRIPFREHNVAFRQFGTAEYANAWSLDGQQ